MSDDVTKETAAEDVFEQAADWLDRLADLTTEERAEFERWLAAAPEHARAFAVMRKTMLDPALLDAATALGTEKSPAPERARRPALWFERMRGFFSGGNSWAAAGATAGLALAIVALWTLAPPTDSASPGAEPVLVAETETAPGDPLTLPDTSRVSLRARTRLEVRMDAFARQVTLHSGEALFDVAPDAERPFRVRAGDLSVSALGTVFSVDSLGGNRVEVRVFEGRVRVTNLDGAGAVLSMGEWLLFGADGEIARGALSRTSQEDWMGRWLHADRLPLDVILTKLNRYTDAPVAPTTGLADETVTGSFALDDADASIAVLARMFDARLIETDTGRRLEPSDR